jgi:hypothetical protein
VNLTAKKQMNANTHNTLLLTHTHTHIQLYETLELVEGSIVK